MATPQRFQGKRGLYEVLDPKPVMFGRLSVFLAARDDRTGDTVLVKSFLNVTETDWAYSPPRRRPRPAVRSFYQEIGAILRLRHPNILQVLDYGEGDVEDSSPFLILPWCKGGNLRQFGHNSDFQPVESAIQLLRQIASAIDYAHQEGVIHGDIKPENILLEADGHSALLADFGMAKHFQVTDAIISKEGGPFAEGEGGGTSAYLSPEQLKDNQQTPLSDIYSFGLVAFELLTGRLPFDPQAPLYRQAQARVAGDLMDPQDANPALSSTVRDALVNALASAPRDRPSTALEFCDMLTGVRQAKTPARASPARRRGLAEVWQGLDATGKAAAVTAAIAALTAIVTALVQIIPALLGKKP